MISLYRECRDWTDPSYHRYMYLTHEVLVDSLVIVVQVGPVRLVELSTLLADNVLGQLELFEGEGQGGVVGVVMIRGPRLIHITGHHSLCPVNSWHGHPTRRNISHITACVQLTHDTGSIHIHLTQFLCGFKWLNQSKNFTKGSYRMNYLNDSMSFNTNVMFTTIKLILFYLHLHNILPVVSQVGLIRACISWAACLPVCYILTLKEQHRFSSCISIKTSSHTSFMIWCCLTSFSCTGVCH